MNTLYQEVVNNGGTFLSLDANIVCVNMTIKETDL